MDERHSLRYSSDADARNSAQTPDEVDIGNQYCIFPHKLWENAACG